MTKSTFKIDEKAVRLLAKILCETDLQEIEYKSEAGHVRVARNIMPVATSVAPVGVAPQLPQKEEHPVPQENTPVETNWEKHPGAVKSPMVATAYLAPQPGADPFIKEGASVEEGQTLMILEAMKVMNPLKAPKSGKVVKILVEDLSPVEFSQPLVIIE